MRPECGHLARDLVSHRKRQAHAARFERDLLPTAQIEIPIPDVDVAVAHTRGFDAQQHLVALGFGIRVLPRFQRLSPFDDLHRTHTGVLQFQAGCSAPDFARSFDDET